MQPYSSSGVKIWMSKRNIIPASRAVSAWGSGNNEIELTDASGVSTGDYLIGESGEINGNIYPVTNVATNTVTLAGLDHTGLAAPAGITHLEQTDMVSLCLAELTVNSNTGATISVGTFCNPAASIPSVVQEAGTLEMTGFIDSSAADYQEIVAASQDGLTRYIAVELPKSLGWLCTHGVLSRMTYDVPLDGGLGFSVSLVMAVPLEHRY